MSSIVLQIILKVVVTKKIEKVMLILLIPVHAHIETRGLECRNLSTYFIMETLLHVRQ